MTVGIELQGGNKNDPQNDQQLIIPECSKSLRRELDGEKLLDRTSFFTEFSTNAYLNDFYEKVEDPAMQMVLTFLPNIVARVGAIKRMLDFGAGPTIHVAASYREKASEIYLADFLKQNRDELDKWVSGVSTFDWSTPLRMILTREGVTWDKLEEVEPETRAKVKGVFHCDCFSDPSVECDVSLQGQFDVVVTIFCVEYCCNSYDEYRQAIRNIGKQIKPGGYLVMGGIFEETWCSFGGRKFTCLYITKELMIRALQEAGLYLELDRTCVLYEINGMFMVCAKKRE